MITRILLLLSCAFGLLLGISLICAGVYAANTDLVGKAADKMDLGSLHRAEETKKEVVSLINESGFVTKAANLLLSIGIVVASISAIGLVAAITAWSGVVIAYIAVNLLLMVVLVFVIILLTAGSSLIEKPIGMKLVNLQNTKFVSVIEIMENTQSQNALLSVGINLVQLKFSCCGVLTVGDIRDSPSWQGSRRDLAGYLKLRTWDAVRRRRRAVAAADNTVPDWVRSRMPPGATLPPGVKLPDKLPNGVRVPSSFNITEDILKDVGKIRKLFEDSLLLQMPISCCRFNDTSSLTNFEAETLLSRMEDQNCPFEPVNGPGMNSETCLSKAVRNAKQYTGVVIIAGIIIGMMMSCNLSLALKIICC